MSKYRYRDPNSGQFSKCTEYQCVVDSREETLERFKVFRLQEERKEKYRQKKRRQRKEKRERRRERNRILSHANFARPFETLQGLTAPTKEEKTEQLVSELLESAFG